MVVGAEGHWATTTRIDISIDYINDISIIPPESGVNTTVDRVDTKFLKYVIKSRTIKTVGTLPFKGYNFHHLRCYIICSLSSVPKGTRLIFFKALTLQLTLLSVFLNLSTPLMKDRVNTGQQNCLWTTELLALLSAVLIGFASKMH